MRDLSRLGPHAHEESLCSSDIIQHGLEAFGIMRVCATVGLDLEGQTLPATLHHQIDFLARRSAPERELGMRPLQLLSSDQILEDKTLPTPAPSRMVIKLKVILNIQQMMQEAGVPNEHSGGFHQPLPDIPEKRRQAPDQENALKKIQAMLDRMIIHSQRVSERGDSRSR